MEFRQLVYFRTILQAGSFTKAAKQLHMAQPPLSRQISQLEAELDVQLLNRRSTGVTPTDAGTLLFNYAEQLIVLRDQADHQVRFLGTAVSGKLRVGLISSAAGVLPSGLSSMTTHYPDIQLLITEGHTYQLVDQLSKRQLDAAIVRTPFSATGMQEKPLRAERMTAVVPKKYEHDLPAHLSIKDLADLPLIVYRRFRSIFAQTFYQAQINPFIASYCDDARTAVQLANARLGVALVPESVGLAYLGIGMTVHPINYAGWRTQVKLIWPKSQAESPLLKLFVSQFYD
ncbi:LysR family transcriptional regulator [Secundilactobacillus silagei]|uniref:LysR family transcriptional regulator n=1 Tax=Secundilactobacillus silagei JCM 19001 TaxID=1302250 RepID=A0A1Z5IK04_9LACO|nr:LysR family transcriptional regulator [Secundilactobacillus silagei]TDG69901.1 hypothetical protein C5L25_002021 [Secundilactobacillus silagei JCM 19001]GAX02105.1 LysR family transcriptional regulator [Secundilactobacillus silagei JCM 19001]